MGCDLDKNAQLQQQDDKISETLARIGNKFLVLSGKGGVGKSTVAANLAIGLTDRGFKVGLLDTDLHGPSICRMLGLEDVQIETSPAGILPVRYSDNLSVISMQFLLESVATPVIWRGPMKIGVIRQFIYDVLWPPLDYLVIDSPPGTGDEPLTVAQTIKNCRGIIVTTPQQVAISDVRKSISFCGQLELEIAGIIENMSSFVCAHCGQEQELFGSGGGARLAADSKIPFLGRIPFVPGVVTGADAGQTVYAVPETAAVAERYNEIIDNLIMGAV